jgi:hypothetical protein
MRRNNEEIPDEKRGMEEPVGEPGNKEPPGRKQVPESVNDQFLTCRGKAVYNSLPGSSDRNLECRHSF